MKKNLIMTLILMFLCLLSINASVQASSTYSIKSKRAKYTLYTGVKQKFQVKQYEKNKKKLKWSSSNKKVATVDKNGNVNTKNPGKAIIKCKVAGKIFQCTLTVKKRTMLSLKFPDSSIKLYVGKRKSMSPIIYPSNTYDKRITYTSSNPKVATINKNGIVSAVGIGTTKITATANDGSKKKDTCTFTVVEKLKKDSVKYIAHRGLSSEAPENTAKAFELAGKAGFWGVETDVRVTKDGEFILLHDETFSRLCGDKRKPEDMTLSEIQKLKVISGNKIDVYKNDESATRICTLKDYLKICQAYGMVPVIEIKISKESYEKVNGTTMKGAGNTSVSTWHNLMIRIDDTVRSIMGGRQYTYISFQKDAISEMSIIRAQRAERNMKLQFLFSLSIYSSKEVENNIAFCQQYGATWNIKDYTNSAEDLIKKARETGFEINVWTVDSIERAEILHAYLVDYITTNVILWK